MAGPWAFWSVAEIARVTKCPQANVESNLPLIAQALDRRGLWERDVAGGVIATVAIETASTFEPVREAFWMDDAYRAALKYAPFWGRGFIQLTHDYNYRAATQALGWDVLTFPDLALDPIVAANILAWYWATKTVPAKDGSRVWTLPELCREHDWEWVRRAVQGGTAGLDRLLRIVTDLGGVQNMPGIIQFNPDATVDLQPDDWSCSVQSTEWLLRSIGRKPSDQWIQTALLGSGIVTTEKGLMDASGAALAQWINREYGSEMGFEAHNANPVTFDDVAAGAGVNPTLIGGRAWNHWVGVRGLRSDGALRLANPAPGYKGVEQLLTREQFAALGPFSAVYIDRAAMGATEPPPVIVPPAPADDTRMPRARAKLVEALAILDEPAPV